MTKNWLITGVSSGFGHELAQQILDRGDRVAGTIRRPGSASDLEAAHPETFRAFALDVSETAAIRPAVDAASAWLGRLDVVVSNAGYGLFGAAEEVSDAQIRHHIDTNLLGSIETLRSAIPHLREAGGGRIVQLSSVAGQTAAGAAGLYHATKWGVEGFAESLAQQVAPFGIRVLIVEPGGARTEFGHGSMQWGERMPEYEGTQVAAIRDMFETDALPIPGDPRKMAAAMIAAVDADEPPLRLVLGSDSYAAITASLEARLAEVRGQQASASATDADD